MIETFTTYQTLFEEINQNIQTHLDIYVIGGAVLLHRDIKPSTKDIDIIVDTKSEFDELIRILRSLDFTDFTPNVAGYENFKLGRQMKQGDLQIDIFLKEVCSKFTFSKEMIRRSENIISLDNVKVYLSSNEDVFAFKTMTDRPGDLDDCIALAQRGLEWEVIFDEIISQIKLSGKDIWITWINERLINLEERGVVIPILDKTDKLSVQYLESVHGKE